MKTISVPEDVHQQLVELKIKEKQKNAAELIKKLIIEYRKKKLEEASRIFREALAKKGITIEDFLKSSRKIREEIADEWYPD